MAEHYLGKVDVVGSNPTEGFSWRYGVTGLTRNSHKVEFQVRVLVSPLINEQGLVSWFNSSISPFGGISITAMPRPVCFLPLDGEGLVS